MKPTNPLIFPISFEDSLATLQRRLRARLRKCFKDSGQRLSPQGYISLQVFEFPLKTFRSSKPVIKYLSTDQYKIYPESANAIKNAIRHAAQSKSTPTDIAREAIHRLIGIADSDLKLAKKRLRDINSKRQFKSVTDNLRRLIDQHLRDYPPSQPVAFYDLSPILKLCLRELEQPWGVGLIGRINFIAQDGRRRPEPTILEDINAEQGETLTVTEVRMGDLETYRLITNIEKYFFVGGMRRSETCSSLVAFAPLFCYGQRAGYLFVIESYSTVEERTQKVALVKNFLKDHVSFCESYLKEVKETRFLHSIGEDILRSGDYSEEAFFDSINKNLGAVVNQQIVRFEKPRSLEAHSKDRLTKRNRVLSIPVRVMDTQVRYLGQLKITLAKDDAEALWKIENRMALLGTLSKGLELIALNRRIQEKERDARWKDIFRRLWHNTQFHLSNSIYWTSKLEQQIETMGQIEHVTPTKYLHDLRYILELSRFVDNPRDYVISRDNQELIRFPVSVNISSVIQEIIDFLKLDIKHNDGGLLRLSDDAFHQALLAAVNTSPSDENRLFHIDIDSRIEILSYREVLSVVLKDILVNATANSTDPKSNGSPLPRVTISLIQDLNGAPILRVRNENGISNEAYNIWKMGRIPNDSKLHNPLGILICRNYLNWLGYHWSIPEECIRENGGTYTTLEIRFAQVPSD